MIDSFTTIYLKCYKTYDFRKKVSYRPTSNCLLVVSKVSAVSMN